MNEYIPYGITALSILLLLHPNIISFQKILYGIFFIIIVGFLIYFLNIDTYSHSLFQYMHWNYLLIIVFGIVLFILFKQNIDKKGKRIAGLIGILFGLYMFAKKENNILLEIKTENMNPRLYPSCKTCNMYDSTKDYSLNEYKQYADKCQSCVRRFQGKRRNYKIRDVYNPTITSVQQESSNSISNQDKEDILPLQPESSTNSIPIQTKGRFRIKNVY